MAKEKNFVNEITARDVDFAQWFTDICLKAELSNQFRIVNRICKYISLCNITSSWHRSSLLH